MGGTPVRILLARHGETVCNVEGRWQGQSDSPLTERGIAQSRELGRALIDEPIAAVYSSDLGRSMQTADEVATRLSLAVQPDMRLREIATGGFTGKTREEIDADYPGVRHIWATAPSSMRLPEGGETLQEAQARALDFFTQRMPDHVGETIVVITHGAVGQAIVVNGMGGSVEDLWLRERVDNCQITRLEWTPDGGLKLIEMADVRHLRDVGSLGSWRTTDAH